MPLMQTSMSDKAGKNDCWNRDFCLETKNTMYKKLVDFVNVN